MPYSFAFRANWNHLASEGEIEGEISSSAPSMAIMEFQPLRGAVSEFRKTRTRAFDLMTTLVQKRWTLKVANDKKQLRILGSIRRSLFSSPTLRIVASWNETTPKCSEYRFEMVHVTNFKEAVLAAAINVITDVNFFLCEKDVLEYATVDISSPSARKRNPESNTENTRYQY